MKILIRDVTLRYGRTTALDRLDLHVPEGSVYALLGRNGSGKSSLMKALLGHRRPDGGILEIDGLDPWKARHRLMHRIAATPETPDAPAAMKVNVLGSFVGSFHRSWDAAGFRGRLDRFGISLTKPFGALSRGQKGLVMLSLALAQKPELLLLDDPTLGLDPVARRFVFDELIGELADRGTTVLLTTHDLEGIERIATHVGMLGKGKLLVEGEIEGLRESAVARGAAAPTLESLFFHFAGTEGN
ncbi:MAG: ABC transporter ATP-binding protein [Thermoanaerobaculia bacterium]